MTGREGILECVLCAKRFTEQDVQFRRYFASTQVCRACYERGQRASFAVWCFGKLNVLAPSGEVLEYGYDAVAEECAQECPDRGICRLFVLGELGMARQKRLKCPFRQTRSMTVRAWMKCATTGISVENLVRWVNRQGGDPVRMLRIMRSGEMNHVQWVVDERNGFLKITNVVTP
jgi:hypothetical protein